MTLPASTLEALFEASLHALLQQEEELIAADVSERSMCGRLSLHMSALLHQYGLDGYFADVEYNRNHGRIKTIVDGNARVIPVTCDLILHSRGRLAQDNLIAVEMKKYRRPDAEKTSDRERLEALTRRDFERIHSGDGLTDPEHVAGYILGVFLQADRQDRRCLAEYFQNGTRVDTRVFGF